MEFRLRIKGRSTPIFVTTINTLPRLSRRSLKTSGQPTHSHTSAPSPTGSSLKGSLNLYPDSSPFPSDLCSIDHMTSLPPLTPLSLTLQFSKSKFYFYHLNRKHTGFFYQHCLTQAPTTLLGRGGKGQRKQANGPCLTPHFLCILHPISS